MGFKMELETGNQAFADNMEGEMEIIFNTILIRMSSGNTQGNIFDSNGNKVGKWKFKED